MGTQEEALEAIEGKRSVGPRQMAIVVGALVVVLAGLWFFFLKGDGSEGAPAGSGGPSASAPADRKHNDKGKAGRKAARNRKDKGAAKVAATAPVENFEVFAPKDPFDPLVSASTGGSGGSGGDTSGDTGGSDDTGSGGDSVGGHTVRLVDIFTASGGAERAQVQVDSSVYRVTEGEVFADNFQLVSIDNGCATMLFGDDQFTLCEGEEILK